MSGSGSIAEGRTLPAAAFRREALSARAPNPPSARRSDAPMIDTHQTRSPQDDWAEHERTYKGFVKGVFLFAVHALAILLILAWVFSDSLSTPSITS
jgi:hypothetical protein